MIRIFLIVAMAAVLAPAFLKNARETATIQTQIQGWK